MLVYYDALNQLSIRVTNQGSQSILQLLDRSTGTDSLLSLLGWTPGNYYGSDPELAGGVALRTREYIQDITGVGGVILERIKDNGSFDRQIGTYDDAIQRMEESLVNYEQRLRDQFARLEVQLAELEAQSASLESALAQWEALRQEQ
jgi:flagellar capping protein FliD